MKFSFFNWLEKQILYFSLIYKNGFNKNIVVHTHFSTHALNLLFSELIIERTNSKTIFTEHYNMIEQIGDHFVKPFYTEKALKALISKFNSRTTVSNFSKALCERYFNSKFIVIPNCLPESYFGATLPKNDLKISFFGGLVFLKGLKELLEVGKNLKPIINNFQLNIFGNNDEQSFFNDFIKKNQLQENIKYHGKKNKNEVKTEIDKSEIILILSKTETFSIVGLEAIARGKKVISSPCFVPKEFITSENGVYLNTFSIDSISTEIIKLLKNPIDYKESVSISQLAQARFSCINISKAYLKLIS